MPCASPDLKQAGACGRRPGQVSRGGGKQPKKNTLEASKGNQNQPYLIQLGKGCPPFSLPPSLVSVAQFSFFPQLYQIQLVLVTLRLAAKDGPPDINSPNLHVKSRKAWKNIGFTCFSCCFHHQVPSLSPTVSDTVGSALPPRDGPGGIRASDLKAPSLNCLVVHPLDPPKSKIRNPKSKIPQSKIQNPNFFGRISGILDFGFWILDRYVAFLYMRPPPPRLFWILDFGFWILDFGFRISDFGFWILDFGFRILDFGFWISDFGFWISDFGFWILDFGFRILDFGFWIWDFGFRILDFGFWVLDFGFWISDFGFWILDFGLGAFSQTFFGCYII